VNVLCVCAFANVRLVVFCVFLWLCVWLVGWLVGWLVYWMVAVCVLFVHISLVRYIFDQKETK
jgi:hypothetical protein